MTALADATDPRFTDGQRAQLAAFERAEVPAEVLLLDPQDGQFSDPQIDPRSPRGAYL